MDFNSLTEFVNYMEKFNGTKRMFLIITEDESLILRPTVVSNLDSAVIRNVKEVDIKMEKERFKDKDNILRV